MSQHSIQGLVQLEERDSGEMEVEPAVSGSMVPVVLVVDDDGLVREAHGRILRQAGMRVIAVGSATAALALLGQSPEPFDAIVSDVIMPGMDGVGLLREVRKHNLDIPVVLITGNPQLETAMAAINHGGFRYLTKPVLHDALVATVTEAVSLHRLARLKREALILLQSHRQQLGDRASLEVHFAEALDRVWIAFQPIVDWQNHKVYGYEALARSSSSVLGSPMLLFDAAERLGRVRDLGRRIRGLVAEQAEGAPIDALLFVNLHPTDLDDEELIDPASPLARYAHRTVLEVTERSSLEDVQDVIGKIAGLRALGYRIAVDDLGAGYAGLATFTQLEPDIAKLDMSLIRGIDISKPKQSLVRSMLAVCAQELGVDVVCEGIETEAERDTLERLGARLLQGYLFGRPCEGFARVTFDLVARHEDVASNMSSA